MNWILNAVLYQLIWFVCILGTGRYQWLGLLLLALHFILSKRRRDDAILMVKVVLIGLVVDGLLKALGLFSFTADAFPIPLWLITIWAAFATMPHHSLSWLKRRTPLAILFGATGGPLAYWAGVRLDAASFGWSTPLSLFCLALVWGTLFPLVMGLARRGDNTAAELNSSSG